MNNSYNITVVGLGYVGLSLSVLLSQKNSVIAIDVDKEKIEKINRRVSPIKDKEISKFLKNKKLNLLGTLEKFDAYTNSKYIIICAPTNFSDRKKEFNTKIIEKIIGDILQINKNVSIIIKSTVPIGFTKRMRKLFLYEDIIFSPEFLREGSALYDNLFPSRIVVGDRSVKAKKFAKIMKSCSKNPDVQTIFTGSSEAEAIKLFANSYLAMRIAYFNELDSYCEINNLNSTEIIKGISLDNRVGNYYNNPSFGYGGYCLPKDTKQLKQNLNKSPNEIICATIDSNEKRKNFIAKNIIKLRPNRVGIYRLIMKSNSDNFRESSIIPIIEKLKRENIDIYIYEPLINEKTILGIRLENNFLKFKSKCDLIIANRLDKKLKALMSKVYTRDIFGNN